MAKIDKIKEILNSLRIAMSIFAGIIVILVGKLFTKFETNQFDLVFWLIFVVTMIVIIAEAVVI